MKNFQVKRRKERVLIEEALKLCEEGMLPEALKTLPIDLGEDLLEDFPSLEAEHNFARGKILGRLAAQRGEPQEIAQNYLSLAYFFYSESPSSGNILRLAETTTEIAYSYWRKGDLQNAFAWLQQAFDCNLPEQHPIFLRAINCKLVLLIAQDNFAEASKLFAKYSMLFGKSSDPVVSAHFFHNFSIALYSLGRFEESLKYIKLAKGLFSHGGLRLFEAAACNSLARAYLATRQFLKAHNFCNEAINGLTGSKHCKLLGSFLDTQAEIYLEEGNLSKAAEAISAAIAHFETAESYAELVKAYIIQLKILVGMKQVSRSLEVFSEASRVAKANLDLANQKELAQEFEFLLGEYFADNRNLAMLDGEAEEFVQYILPPGLPDKASYEIASMNEPLLEGFGIASASWLLLRRGHLIEEGKLYCFRRRGKLIAGIAYYESDLDLYRLELPSGVVPVSLKELIGEVVGHCSLDATQPLAIKPVDF